MLTKKWVLLDDEGLPVRYYNYEAEGTIEIKEVKLNFDEMIEQIGECLL